MSWESEVGSWKFFGRKTEDRRQKQNEVLGFSCALTDAELIEN